MTTRAEMAEACRYAIGRACGPNVGFLYNAAATLIRDGELREMLSNLCAATRELGNKEAAALARHVEALLKGTSDDGT